MKKYQIIYADPPWRYQVRSEIVRLMDDLPRIELFAREKTEGWDVWGNEVDNDIDLVPNIRSEG